MKKISNSTMISVITKLFILLIIAKSIALGFYLYLPDQGQELKLKTSYQPQYQRVDFKNMLSSQIRTNKPTSSPKKSSGAKISNMILKGLYGSKTNGFIIVAMKKAPKKTTILSIGEIFQGYKLKRIGKNSAVFIKNNKEYVLSFKKVDIKSNITKVKNTSNGNNDKSISRKDIKYYAKNTKQMMKDISIREIKDGKNLKGFKVMKIRKNSKMASLGLKKGDLITAVNNTKLKSYQDAFKIYGDIDELDFIQLVIIRNNEEMELEYEIN